MIPYMPLPNYFKFSVLFKMKMLTKCPKWVLLMQVVQLAMSLEIIWWSNVVWSVAIAKAKTVRCHFYLESVSISSFDHNWPFFRRWMVYVRWRTRHQLLYPRRNRICSTFLLKNVERKWMDSGWTNRCHHANCRRVNAKKPKISVKKFLKNSTK